jgi:hypothetical protein
MTQSAPKAVTLSDIANEIVQLADVEGVDMPGLHKTVWFEGPWGADAEGTVVRHGELLPFNPNLRVFKIFEDANEIRVYAMATVEAKEPGPPSMYRLNKATRVYTASSMSLSVFKDEVAVELRKIAFPDDDSPFDLVECPACTVEVPELAYCGACGKALPDPDAPNASEVAKQAANGAVAVVPAGVAPQG